MSDGSGVARAEWALPALPGVFVVALIAVEAIAAELGSLAGAIGEAVLVLLAVNLYAIAPRRAALRPLFVLALPALARLVDLTLPPSRLSTTAHLALAGASVLIALGLLTRIVPWQPAWLRMRRAELPFQCLVALAGIPLGLLGHAILAVHPLASGGDGVHMAIAVVVLCALSAPAAELLFRGVLLAELIPLYGPGAIALVSLLSASWYLGTRSPGYVALMGLTGLLLSLATLRSGRIWGAIGAHALLAVGVLVVWPAVL